MRRSTPPWRAGPFAGGGFGGFGDLGDILGQMFGGAFSGGGFGGFQPATAPYRERPALQLTFSFEEAAFGAEKENYDSA